MIVLEWLLRTADWLETEREAMVGYVERVVSGEETPSPGLVVLSWAFVISLGIAVVYLFA